MGGLAFALWSACAAGPRVSDIEQLGKAGDVAALVALFDDSRSWVREEAARVMGVQRMAAARGVLAARVRAADERRFVRAAAVRALGRIGDPRDRAELEALARVPGSAPELKLALVTALCRLKPQQSTYDVLMHLAADEDLLVSAAAATEVDRKCAR